MRAKLPGPVCFPFPWVCAFLPCSHPQPGFLQPGASVRGAPAQTLPSRPHSSQVCAAGFAAVPTFSVPAAAGTRWCSILSAEDPALPSPSSCTHVASALIYYKTFWCGFPNKWVEMQDPGSGCFFLQEWGEGERVLLGQKVPDPSGTGAGVAQELLGHTGSCGELWGLRGSWRAHETSAGGSSLQMGFPGIKQGLGTRSHLTGDWRGVGALKLCPSRAGTERHHPAWRCCSPPGAIPNGALVALAAGG